MFIHPYKNMPPTKRGEGYNPLAKSHPLFRSEIDSWPRIEPGHVTLSTPRYQDEGPIRHPTPLGWGGELAHFTYICLNVKPLAGSNSKLLSWSVGIINPPMWDTRPLIPCLTSEKRLAWDTCQWDIWLVITCFST